MFLGFSSQHSTNVGFVLNLKTGHERNEFLDELDNVPNQLPVLDDNWLTPTEIDTRQSQRVHHHTETRETNRMMSPSPASVVLENITTLETPAQLQNSP
jgi:hypothetical protein